MKIINKNKKGLEKLEEVANLKNQVKVVRLQEKLCIQDFHNEAEKLYEPITTAISDKSQKLLKSG